MQTRRLAITTLALGFSLTLTLTLAATALAQDEGQGRRGGRGGFGGFGGFGFGGFGTIDKPTLLGSTQVRTELKVSEEQGKKLDEILAAHREELRGLFTGQPRGRDVPEEEREKARKEMAEKRTALVAKTDGKLAEILRKEQTARLDEILLQQQGVDALVSAPIVAAIKIEKEKVEKIQAVFKTRDDQLSEIRGSFRGRGRGRGPGGDGGAPGGGQGGFEEIRTKMEKIRKDAETAALAVLSEEQKAAFTKLQGKPFELDRSTLFRGDFGGGRGGRERARPPVEEPKEL
jgi:hypothetical protein